jgi:peptide/nickel transport system ATP-binding protein
VIEFDNLSIEFTQADLTFRALRDCSFRVNPGEAVALVGESGSGKTTAARAVLGDIGRSGVVAGGTVRVCGHECFGIDRRHLATLRKTEIAYVPQNPGASLNPVRRVEKQIAEMIPAHSDMTVGMLLDRVQLDRRLGRRYPHQLSGGQQQRVSLAIALASASKVLILDEPTTGLDVGVQVEILQLFRSIVDDGLAVLYVTHDLAAAAVVADRLVVLYAGEIVETGRLTEIYEHPRHPYTEALLAAVPTVSTRVGLKGIPGVMLPGSRRGGCCVFHNRCVYREERCQANRPASVTFGTRAVRCFRAEELSLQAVARSVRNDVLADEVAGEPRSALVSVDGLSVVYRTAPRDRSAAVDNVTLEIGSGETLALVGESGSGKTSLARAITGLASPSTGLVKLDGIALPKNYRDRSVEQLRRIQYIFQNSALALNPRRNIEQTLTAPLLKFFGDSRRRSQHDERIVELLEMVGLPQRLLGLRPRDLSGGEQQRVAVARALAAEPDVVICDEIVSALDVSVQAAIVALLGELQESTGVAILFISHDLGVVRSIAHRTAVMFDGSVVEVATTERVFDAPQHAYTKSLLEAVPDVSIALQGRPATSGPVVPTSGEEWDLVEVDRL